MNIQKIRPDTIEAYIDAAPQELQPGLWALHECIRKAAPGVKEELKWSRPAYSYDKILVTFAVFKNHIGFYPTAAVIGQFAKELSAYKTAQHSVQFPIVQPLPLVLIGKMVKFRVKESREGTLKWRS